MIRFLKEHKTHNHHPKFIVEGVLQGTITFVTLLGVLGALFINAVVGSFLTSDNGTYCFLTTLICLGESDIP